MAGEALRWQRATVIGIRPETPTAKTFRMRLEQPSGHRAGQHYVLRLTAPDGYTASRSYSVASPPDGSAEIELTVERLPEGEVSMFLHDELVIGDELEVRGPIGLWFVWEADTPAVLVGGGSGVVPLMAMLRLGRLQGKEGLARLVVSVRRPGDLYYATELSAPARPDATVIYTREAPAGSARAPGHLALDDLVPAITAGATAYVCGSSAFADAATDLLLAAGVEAPQIRVERFGPSG